jgi:hypothetical protein
MSNAMCHKVTLPKLLAALKRIFFDPVGPSDISLFDRILSMDDGFECLLKEWSSFALCDVFHGQENPSAYSDVLQGLSKIYDVWSGRVFSVIFETDRHPDLTKKLAEVGTCCEVLSGIVIKCTLFHLQKHSVIVSVTLWSPAFRQVFISKTRIQTSRFFTS